jgi:hypothetical protein
MDVTGYAALERPQYRNSIPAVFEGVAWWASCAVFLLLETCLGLKINGAERKVTFTDPYLPEFLPELKMKGLRVGDATVDLSLARHESDVGINVIRRRGRVGVVVVK